MTNVEPSNSIDEAEAGCRVQMQRLLRLRLECHVCNHLKMSRGVAVFPSFCTGAYRCIFYILFVACRVTAARVFVALMLRVGDS